MSVWEFSFTIEELVLDISIISALLILGTVARRYIRVFQVFLIPNNLIAGFTGLLLGPEVLNLLSYSTDRMGVYVYHLLALTFISVGLQHQSGRTRGGLQFGFIMVMSYLLQALIGLGVALLVMFLLVPDLVPAVGMLLPLGFGMGPGIAYSIGQAWGEYGFSEAASVGLTIAALGFLIAYISGIVIVNRGVRKGRAHSVTSESIKNNALRTGLIEKDRQPVGARLTFHSGAIEPLTFHVALVGAIYLLTYGVVTALAEGLMSINLEKEVTTLWSFNFIIANLLALVAKHTMNRRGIDYVIDSGMLHRITGFLADLLIAASIMAISLRIAWAYALPIVLMVSAGAMVTYASNAWACKRVFQDYPFERFAGIYGEMTGTISSGLALLRVVDPDYSTPIAQDLVLGSGFALVIGFPLLIVINMPFSIFDGRLIGYAVVIGILIVYLLIIFAVWSRFGLRFRKDRN